MNRRRRSHIFLATKPDGTEGKVSVLAYGKDQAFALLESKGYSNIENYKAEAKYSVDKAAVQRLARAWGITWELRITVRHAPKGKKNGSATARFDGLRPIHYITISPLGDDPERTIRHELGHCLYNEQNYERLGRDFLALVALSKDEHEDYPQSEYRNRPTEIFARSHEQRDRHVRLTSR